MIVGHQFGKRFGLVAPHGILHNSDECRLPRLVIGTCRRGCRRVQPGSKKFPGSVHGGLFLFEPPDDLGIDPVFSASHTLEHYLWVIEQFSKAGGDFKFWHLSDKQGNFVVNQHLSSPLRKFMSCRGGGC